MGRGVIAGANALGAHTNERIAPPSLTLPLKGGGERAADFGSIARRSRHFERADWQSPADIRKSYGSASFLNDNRVCFNIRVNKYRLIVRVLYRHHAVYIRFIGTHKSNHGPRAA